MPASSAWRSAWRQAKHPLPEPPGPGPSDADNHRVAVHLDQNLRVEKAGHLHQRGGRIDAAEELQMRPADVPDALSAAAWLAGLDRETYAQLERAT